MMFGLPVSSPGGNCVHPAIMPRETNILISPATVEMAGLFVVPLEKDFKKVTFADLEKVWEEVSITEDEENELIRKIRDEV